jgi:hypothetical protein
MYRPLVVAQRFFKPPNFVMFDFTQPAVSFDW